MADESPPLSEDALERAERIAGEVFASAGPADYDTAQTLSNAVFSLATEVRRVRVGAGTTGGADRPSLDLLVKLGSALIHAQEYIGPGGREVDSRIFFDLLDDADVQAWIKEMGALLPVKRELS